MGIDVLWIRTGYVHNCIMTMRIGFIVKRIAPQGFYRWLLRAYYRGIWIFDCMQSRLAQKRVDRYVAKLRKGNRPIRFGFYVIQLSTFQMKRVFDLMVTDSSFDPFVVVVPEERGNKDEALEIMQKTYQALYREYGDRVYLGYKDGIYHNFLERCDACSMMYPYKRIAKYEFSIECFSLHGKPVFFSPYTYYTDVVWSQEMYSLGTYKYMFKVFCANDAEREYIGKCQGMRYCKRVSVTGNPKTDGIYCSRNINKRKVILIAPHHSIVPDDFVGFHIGNFLKYYKFYLSLPGRYPQIDWVLRPHPVLKLRLMQDAGWSQQEWDSYINEFSSNTNARFEDGCEYYDTFACSDAMIQDCSSFLPEYFFTGKPQCYLLDSPNAACGQFGEFGMKMLNLVYKAYDESQIVSFINDIVLPGKDPMRSIRDEFAGKVLMKNHPHVSEKIVEEIKKCLNIN